MERQVETDQARLERGQITLADLAQSESSLAGAKANLIKGQTEFLASKINFLQAQLLPYLQPPLFLNLFNILCGE